MYKVRRWVSANPIFFHKFYQVFEAILISLHPLFKLFGYQRLDKPVAIIEKGVKGFLFDSQMCGMCTLSSTGMTCPMNCPKRLRNGPCGGVRQNGHCEVKPDMPCVWVDIVQGSRTVQQEDKLRIVQLPVDHQLQGSSSWLKEVRDKIASK